MTELIYAFWQALSLLALPAAAILEAFTTFFNVMGW